MWATYARRAAIVAALCGGGAAVLAGSNICAGAVVKAGVVCAGWITAGWAVLTAL